MAGFGSALREQRIADALARYRGERLVGGDDATDDARTASPHRARERPGVARRGGALDAARTRLAAAMTPALAVGRPALQGSGVTRCALRRHAQGHAAAVRRVPGHAVAQPGPNAVERDEAAAWLATWVAAAATARPGLSLDDLTHCIVAEAALAHAPLIAPRGDTPPRCTRAGGRRRDRYPVDTRRARRDALRLPVRPRLAPIDAAPRVATERKAAMHRQPRHRRPTCTAMPHDPDTDRWPAWPRPSADAAPLLWLQALRRQVWRWQRLAVRQRGTASRVWC